MTYSSDDDDDFPDCSSCEELERFLRSRHVSRREKCYVRRAIRQGCPLPPEYQMFYCRNRTPLQACLFPPPQAGYIPPPLVAGLQGTSQMDAVLLLVSWLAESSHRGSGRHDRDDIDDIEYNASRQSMHDDSLHFGSTSDSRTRTTPRRSYDELQSRRALREEWRHRNAVPHRGTEGAIARTSWECECDGFGVLCTACSVASSRSMDDDFWHYGSLNDARLSSSPRPPSTRPQVRGTYHEVRSEGEDARRRQIEGPVGGIVQAGCGAQGDLASRLRELEAIYNCAICFENRRNVIFTCGHGACATCARNLMACHICRQTITQSINVY
ncbi:uncharacterized protein LOC144118309 [Amblyomma americanum]